MKKIILLIMILSIKQVTHAQKYGVPDTLAYLHEVVANKAKYIGQPFSKLQADLKLKIKWFSPFAHFSYRRYTETSTSFAFYFPLNQEEIYLTYPCLKVFWYPYLDTHKSDEVIGNNRGKWSAAASTLYSTAIIYDIWLQDMQ